MTFIFNYGWTRASPYVRTDVQSVVRSSSGRYYDEHLTWLASHPVRTQRLELRPRFSE